MPFAQAARSISFEAMCQPSWRVVIAFVRQCGGNTAVTRAVFSSITILAYRQGVIMANNLMRFDPFGDIARFEPFRNISEFFKDFRMTPGWRDLEAEPRIRMDLSETEQAYVVKAEIPGVKKEDIKVAIDGNQVSISAEVRKEEDQKSGSMVRSERYYGQQYRSFTLPQEVDDEKTEAKYQDGMLELTLPKKPGTTSKQIAIQ
jgi:HSP20 family protein